MISRFFVFYLSITALLCISSCSTSGDDSDKLGDKDSVLVYKLSQPQYVFGFVGQSRYSYCPSALQQEDGSVHVFFCGNPTQGIMVDNVYHIQTFPTGKRTEAESVLQPSLSWDSHHTCDPCVIEGAFKLEGVSYKYAMFFLSNPLSYYYNEIGVAFSNDLSASKWVKYPKQLITKTWAGEGDQSLGGSAKSWGVGQPSAVSLDKKGNVLVTYTIGDSNGTRIVLTELDMSDMSNLKVLSSAKAMSVEGLLNLNDAQDYTCNCDFAANIEANKIVMIRPVQPHPSTYPSYIPVAQEIDYMDFDSFLAGVGRWTKIARVSSDVSNFPRNHNSCILRDNYGYIKDWQTPTVYYTVSKEAPEVNASTGEYPEWTYHIYKTSVTKSYRYFYDK